MVEILPGKDPEEMTLFIEGKEITMNSARFLRTMDTGTDALNCSFAWEPDLDPEIDELTEFYSYSETGLYIGGILQQVGVLYDVTKNRSSSGTTKDLSIFNKTADIIDSTLIPPYEVSNISLTDRCIQQCFSFGIDVVIGDGVNLLKERRVVTGNYQKGKTSTREFPAEIKVINDIMEHALINKPQVTTKGTYKVTGSTTVREEQIIDRVSGKQTDKIFTHLSKLAAQYGLLLSCTKYGDLIVTKANTEAEPVGTIEEINPIANEYSVTCKGRDRFTMYRSIASSSRSAKTAAASTVRDLTVVAPRVLSFRAPNNLPGEAKSAAEWRKNKTAADALEMPFPVNSWYAPNGKLWEPNTTVTVISPTVGIKKGFTFLITKVEFVYKPDGVSANLSLKPPTTYTTGEIVEPWQGS